MLAACRPASFAVSLSARHFAGTRMMNGTRVPLAVPIIGRLLLIALLWPALLFFWLILKRRGEV